VSARGGAHNSRNVISTLSTVQITSLQQTCSSASHSVPFTWSECQAEWRRIEMWQRRLDWRCAEV